MLRPAAAGLEGSDAHPRYPTRGSATPAVRSAAVRMSGNARPSVSDRHGPDDETPSGGSWSGSEIERAPAPARGRPGQADANLPVLRTVTTQLHAVEGAIAVSAHGPVRFTIGRNIMRNPPAAPDRHERVSPTPRPRSGSVRPARPYPAEETDHNAVPPSPGYPGWRSSPARTIRSSSGHG